MRTLNGTDIPFWLWRSWRTADVYTNGIQVVYLLPLRHISAYLASHSIRHGFCALLSAYLGVKFFGAFDPLWLTRYPKLTIILFVQSNEYLKVSYCLIVICPSRKTTFAKLLLAKSPYWPLLIVGGESWAISWAEMAFKIMRQSFAHLENKTGWRAR